MPSRKPTPTSRRLSLRRLLIVAVILGTVIGGVVNVQLTRRRIAAELKTTAMPHRLRILTYAGLFSPSLIKVIQKNSSLQLVLTECADPEELWNLLEASGQKTAAQFDVVTLFSYQAPLASQLGWLKEFDFAKIRGATIAIAPDFREPNSGRNAVGPTTLTHLVPLLWGLEGLAYNSNVLREAPTSWQRVFETSSLAKRIALPSSTAWIAWLLAIWRPKDEPLTKGVPALSAIALFDPDFFSAVHLLSPGPTAPGLKGAPAVLMATQGEMAFQPLRGSPWVFTVPSEGTPLWVLSLAAPQSHDGSGDTDTDVQEFFAQMVGRESAADLVRITHQASANRLMEASELDQRLKPSYLRQVKLDKVVPLKDDVRAREIRQLIAPASSR